MRKRLLSILALAILVTSTLVGCSGASPTDSTLTIFSITEGTVLVMKAGTDDWTEARAEMPLEVGDVIKTGDDSGAEITFFDGSTIELEAGTQIEITSLDTSPDTGTKTITLMQTIGTTISRVTKLLDPASSYAVETPTGVAAVRGSVMIVRVVFDDPNYEDGTVLITNVEGDIWAIGKGVELHIPEGQQGIITDGLPPELIPSNEPSQEESGNVTDEDTSSEESGELQPGGSATNNLIPPPMTPPPVVVYSDPPVAQTPLAPPANNETRPVVEVTMTMVSDNTTKVIWVRGSSDNSSRDASDAWVHDAWSGVSYSFPDGTTWIWESYRTEHPEAGDTVRFEKTFNIPGFPVSGTLYITCDNGYEVYVNDNGSPAGDAGAMSAQLGSGWQGSNLTEDYVNTYGWQSVESWNITDFIHSGVNTINIATANEYMGPDDDQSSGTQESNPAGLIFELVITYETESPGSE